jgi:excisionase family DNA binding protein
MKPRHAAATRRLTVDEVADYLRVSRSTIYRLLKRNQLPALRIGNDLRFDVEEIDCWRMKKAAYPSA